MASRKFEDNDLDLGGFLIELAVTLPLMLIMIFGSLSLVYGQRQSVIAQEASRYAARVTTTNFVNFASGNVNVTAAVQMAKAAALKYIELETGATPDTSQWVVNASVFTATEDLQPLDYMRCLGVFNAISVEVIRNTNSTIEKIIPNLFGNFIAGRGQSTYFFSGSYDPSTCDPFNRLIQ